MKFAKPCFDVGLATNLDAPMRAFWGDEVGLPYDHLLKVMPGQHQHRYAAAGSVVKINNHRDPLADAPPSGYRELLLAHKGAEQALIDPDGNKVRLVPKGTYGVTQLAMRMAVCDLQAHRDFYTRAFGFAEAAYAPPEGEGAAFVMGEGRLLLAQSSDATPKAGFRGKGWRYITFQVFNVDEAHAHVLAAGGREAMAPTTLGETARISMVRDPDGNWIELSQRASLVGALG